MYVSSGENSCVGAASSPSLEGGGDGGGKGGGRTHFGGRSGAECQTRTRRRCYLWKGSEGGEEEEGGGKKRGELQTKALPQLLHYHNTRKTTPRDAAEVVIRKQIDRIYKFSAFGGP